MVKIATEYPTMTVVGYDAAASVVEKNRAEYADLSNISFEQTLLPSFNVDQQFDFVVCYAPLRPRE